MAYSEEQIEDVCRKVSASISDFVVPQIATFTRTPIIAGMKAEKTFDEICADMWEAIDTLPPLPDTYALAGQCATNGNPMVNVCKIACGALHQALLALEEEGGE